MLEWSHFNLFNKDSRDYLYCVKTPYLTLFDRYICLQDFLEKTHNPYQEDVGSPKTLT